MPKIRVRDIRMYYEEHGPAGAEPLVLIAGLSLNTTTWYRQIPALAKRFRVIAFDNRGAGRSDHPNGTYSIAQFADDTAALLDELVIDDAHVCGMSMGGMIAQELALRHPERVRSLALLCTTPGGPRAAPSMVSMNGPETAGMSTAELFDRSLPWFYSDAYGAAHRDEIAARAAENAHLRLDPAEFMRQAMAIAGHNTQDRLGKIEAPALVLAGAEDPLIPIANPRLLRDGISGARCVEYPLGRHYFHIEFAEDVNRELLSFFAAVPAGRRG